MYYVYIIRNLLNSKTYIGKHKVSNVKKDTYMGSGSILNQAYQKYGKENFIKHIIDYAESIEEINELEKCYIAMFRAINMAEYNILNGGDGVSPENVLGSKNPMYGKNAFVNKSDEEMQIIRQHMSKSHSGKLNSMYGKNAYENMTFDEYNLMIQRKSEKGKQARAKLKLDTKNFDLMRKRQSESQKLRYANMTEEEKLNWRKNAKIAALNKNISDEWRKNRSEQSKKQNIGRKWFNNGQVEKFLYDCPDGWTKGRLKRK